MEEGNFEDIPLYKSYREVLESWQSVEQCFDDYFENNAQTVAVMDCVVDHVNTLPNFIDEYLETSEESEEDACATLKQNFISMHQTLFQAYIDEYDLSDGEYIFLTDNAVLADSKEFFEQVCTLETENDEPIGIVRSINIVVGYLVLGNARSILETHEAHKEEIQKHEVQSRKDSLKAHATDVAKFALGTIIGGTVLHILQKGHRRSV